MPPGARRSPPYRTKKVNRGSGVPSAAKSDAWMRDASCARRARVLQSLRAARVIGRFGHMGGGKSAYHSSARGPCSGCSKSKSAKVCLNSVYAVAVAVAASTLRRVRANSIASCVAPLRTSSTKSCRSMAKWSACRVCGGTLMGRSSNISSASRKSPVRTASRRLCTYTHGRKRAQEGSVRGQVRACGDTEAVDVARTMRTGR